MAAKTWAPNIPSDLKYLILHESPGEVRTISKFLPKGYMAMATIGHFMQTSSKQLDVDVEKWQLLWKPDPKKKSNLNNIKKAIDVVRKNNGKVILAGDHDREGFVINFEVVDFFKLKPGQYLVHKDPGSLAEKEYLKNLNAAIDTLDMNIVEAGITRQILDKYVGFEVTEHLWNVSSKYKPFLEEIEKEIQTKIKKFEDNNGEILKNNTNIQKVIQTYKDLFQEETKSKKALTFKKLNEFENRKGTSFGRVQTASLILLVLKEFEKFDKELERKVNIQAEDNNKLVWEYSKNGELETNVVEMKRIYDKLDNSLKNKSIKSINVIDIKSKIQKKSPPATLDTIDAQKGISNFFGYGVEKTMSILQKLYEGSFTTYMRTDTNSVTKDYEEYLSQMVGQLGDKAVHREYSKKGAQEGHIGILPTKEYQIENLASGAAAKLIDEEYKIFEFVVRRSVAAFMEEAEIEYFDYTLEVTLEDGSKELFILKDSNIVKEGYLKVYHYDKSKYQKKVNYKIGDNIQISQFIWKEKDIKLPGGYSETSFIDELKSNGIGRPSTYASIIKTLLGKEYIKMNGKKLEVTPKGFWVYKVVTENDKTFGRFKNVDFTAKMEEGLDHIAKGSFKRERILDVIKKEVETFKRLVPKKEVGTGATGENFGKCPSCGKGDVRENAKAYGCSNWRGGCKFTIWKVTAGHEFTKEEVEGMIKNKKSEELTFKSKAGKDFNASLVFDKKKGFTFDFGN